MHWVVERAQTMLGVPSVYISRPWKVCQEYRIEREPNPLYPHRAVVTERLAAWRKAGSPFSFCPVTPAAPGW